MRVLDREKDSISLSPTISRDALWMTIHGATQSADRVLLLSSDEAAVLAEALWEQVQELKEPAL
jgi:hypothetical protein